MKLENCILFLLILLVLNVKGYILVEISMLKARNELTVFHMQREQGERAERVLMIITVLGNVSVLLQGYHVFSTQ